MVVLRRRNENKTVEIPTICFSSFKTEIQLVLTHTVEFKVNKRNIFFPELYWQ